MSRTFPGRFNTASVGAVYVSREPETAIEELRRRAARDGLSLSDMHPRSIFVIDLHLHEVVDLMVAGQLQAWGLTAEDLASDDMDRCREVAGVATRLGAEGIRWASATGTGQSIAVFVEHLRPGSRVQIVRTFELTRTMLRTIEEGASLAGLLPELRGLPLIPQIVASDPTEPAE
jgi:RES domain-containing protein